MKNCFCAFSNHDNESECPTWVKDPTPEMPYAMKLYAMRSKTRGTWIQELSHDNDVDHVGFNPVCLVTEAEMHRQSQYLNPEVVEWFAFELTPKFLDMNGGIPVVRVKDTAPTGRLKFTSLEEWRAKATEHGATFVEHPHPAWCIEAVVGGLVIGDWDEYEGFGVINLETLA